MRKAKQTVAEEKNLQIILESARNLFPRVNNSSMPVEEQVIKKVDEQAEESSKKPPHTYKEFYAVNYPYGYVRIQADKETGKLQYLTIEPTMTEQEEQALAHLKIILKEKTNVPLIVLKDATLIEQYLNSQIARAIKAFNLKITNDSSWKIYLLYRKRLPWLRHPRHPHARPKH